MTIRLLLALLFAFGPTFAWAQTTQKPLVMMVNYQDSTTQPWTPTSVNFFFTGSSGLINQYRAWSYGAFTWDVPDVIPNYLTIPFPTRCATQADAGYAAAQAAAQIGQAAYLSYPVHIFLINSPCGNSFSSGSNVYARGLGALPHELGHVVGFGHSNSLGCISTGCTYRWYDDNDDTMGNGGGHPNALWKEQIGWLNAPNQPRIDTITATGTYVLEPYETRTLGVKALKVPLLAVDPQIPNGTVYVESRGAGIVRLRASLTSGSVGATVVLDLAPTTTTTDLRLDVGQVVIVGGVEFSVLSASSAGTAVWVNRTPVIIPPPPPPDPCVVAPFLPRVSVTGNFPLFGSWRGSVTATDTRGCTATVTQ